MELNAKELAAEVLRLAGTDVKKCMQCGKCSASCSAAPGMDFLPHRVVWELLNGDATALLAAQSPWRCQSCLACEERCPRGVSPARLMEALRLVQIRAQGGNRLNPQAVENYPADMPQQALVAAFRKYNK